MTNESEQRAETAPRRAPARLLAWLRHGASGQVAVTFAIVGMLLILVMAGLFDASQALNAHTRLQDASDEAALAVSIAAANNPNDSLVQLRTIAQNSLAANFPNSTPTLTDFHVCDPVLNDCADGSTTMTMGTVAVAASAPTSCLFGALVPMFCAAGSTTQTVGAKTLTTIGFGKTEQINIVMDSSASMIVGATSADVTTISNWVGAHWSQVKPGDPPPTYAAGDKPPCAFACHDVGSATTPADIATGLANAHAAGATTRFDVMTAAAQQLITHVQTVQTTNSALAKNTYLFNIMSFDTTLHQYGATNIPTFTAAQSAIASVTPGLDTDLSTSLTQLTTQVGVNGSGTSATAPIKFLILVTDGLQSDRTNNWTCSSWATDPAWNYYTCYGGYAAPINTTQCQQIKNNGVILAVLETPYVPLTGQSPVIAPYEKTVRHVLYPGGPGSASAVSAALQACASSGYYFQAVNSSDIATGFTTLTDQFLNQSVAISK